MEQLLENIIEKHKNKNELMFLFLLYKNKFISLIDYINNNNINNNNIQKKNLCDIYLSNILKITSFMWKEEGKNNNIDNNLTIKFNEKFYKENQNIKKDTFYTSFNKNGTIFEDQSIKDLFNDEFYIYNPENNGNCGFEALYMGLLMSSKDIDKIIEKYKKPYLFQYEVDLFRFILFMEIYIKDKKNDLLFIPGIWLTDDYFQNISDILNINIISYNHDYLFFYFHNSKSDNLTLFKNSKEIIPEEQKKLIKNNPKIIIYFKNNHFELLFFKKDNLNNEIYDNVEKKMKLYSNLYNKMEINDPKFYEQVKIFEQIKEELKKQELEKVKKELKRKEELKKNQIILGILCGVLFLICLSIIIINYVSVNKNMNITNN